MKLPPGDLLAGLSDEDRIRTERWWGELDEAAREEFALLWDSRSDETELYGAVVDGKLTWHPVPIQLRGFPTDDEQPRDHWALKEDLYEFVVGHEEIQFFLIDRQFHICRAHSAAREVIKRGFLPKSFQCPLSDAACPMRKLMRACPGKSVRLVAAPGMQGKQRLR